jgi:hypothetical protein
MTSYYSFLNYPTPILTNSAGTIPRQHLFCPVCPENTDESDYLDGIRQKLSGALKQYYCFPLGPTSDSDSFQGKYIQNEPTRIGHFTRKYWGIAFELRIWKIPKDRSLCDTVLPNCPNCPNYPEAGFIVEFQKVDGPSHQWTDLFSEIAGYLLFPTVTGEQLFFVFGEKPKPFSKLDNAFLSIPDADSDEDDTEDDASIMSTIMLSLAMLEDRGTFEDQVASIQSLLTYADTPRKCNMLVEFGFLERAYELAVNLYRSDDMSFKNLSLLRGIMLVITSIVSLGGKQSITAVPVPDLVSFVKSICDDPMVYTHEMEPLRTLFE